MKNDMNKRLFEMLDKLIVDIVMNTRVNNSYPVDGGLIEEAHDLLVEYAMFSPELDDATAKRMDLIEKPSCGCC
tara:strand:+ start:306 stop:527 length:222 start_codon:yes stop_codon:yes gene_type:complete